MNEASGCGFYPGPHQHSDATRPFEEMQSDNRFVTRFALTAQYATKEQFNDQQKPKCSGQRHHSPRVDGKSLEELLAASMHSLFCDCLCFPDSQTMIVVNS